MKMSVFVILASIFFSAPSAHARTTVEELGRTVLALAQALPTGNYEGQAYRKNLFGKLVEWSGKKCEVKVNFYRQGDYLSYGIGAFVMEEGGVSILRHANLDISTSNSEQRTTVSIENTGKGILFDIDFESWSHSTLTISNAYFNLRTDKPAYRGGLEGDVYCGALSLRGN